MERCGPSPQDVLGPEQRSRKDHSTLHQKYTGSPGQGDAKLSHWKADSLLEGAPLS